MDFSYKGVAVEEDTKAGVEKKRNQGVAVKEDMKTGGKKQRKRKKRKKEKKLESSHEEISRAGGKPVDSVGSSKGDDKEARSAKAKSSDTTATAAAEKVRKRLRKKVKSSKTLAAVFSTLDVDHNGLLSKAEFGRLVCAVLKTERPSQELVSAAWDAAWQLRKHGSDDEMDAETLANWLQFR